LELIVSKKFANAMIRGAKNLSTRGNKSPWRRANHKFEQMDNDWRISSKETQLLFQELLAQGSLSDLPSLPTPVEFRASTDAMVFFLSNYYLHFGCNIFFSF
jgi:hypothetical protein